jgi:hypothetical protein
MESKRLNRHGLFGRKQKKKEVKSYQRERIIDLISI